MKSVGLKDRVNLCVVQRRGEEDRGRIRSRSPLKFREGTIARHIFVGRICHGPHYTDSLLLAQ